LIVLDDGWVVVGGRQLDAASGWVGAYALPGGRPEAQGRAAGRMAAVTQGRRGGRPTMSVWSFPAPGVAERDRPGFVLEPGDRVSLDLDGLEASSADRRRLAEHLTELLGERGVEVTREAQPIRVAARTRTDRERRVARRFGESLLSEGTGVTVTSKTSTLSIEVDGEGVWSTTSGSGGGGDFRIREGQSMQQAVDASAGEHRPVDAFVRTDLPDRFVDPRDPPGRVYALEAGKFVDAPASP
jgi:hypothetical protein